MKISNYSLNYSEPLSSGEMDLFGFLSLCGQLDLEGASLHPQLAGYPRRATEEDPPRVSRQRPIGVDVQRLDKLRPS